MILTGNYLKTFYRNNKTGYTYFSFKSDNDDNGQKFHMCAGCIPHYAEGAPLILEGDKVIQGGKELFKFNKATPNINDNYALLSFLRAYLPAGMGKACSEKIVSLLTEMNVSADEFFKSPDAAQVLADKIKGFNLKNATVYINKIMRSITELSLLNELSIYGISYTQLHALFDQYGAELTSKISEHPYTTLCTTESEFSCADSYAKDHGFGYCDKERISKLVAITYLTLSNMGECFGSFSEIMKLFRRVENQLSRFNEVIPDAVVAVELFKNKEGLVDFSSPAPRFYTKTSWDAEEDILRHILRLKNSEHELVPHDFLNQYVSKNGTHLDEYQTQAFDMLDKSDPVFIIGGPGTGKTTVIKRLVECLKSYNSGMKISLCAPTGRAAERIKEATGYPASTVHLLLEYQILDGVARPNRNDYNPLDVDVLIIDEFSMVGIYLFSALLNALPSETKIIIVGDWNQLQPIEPGFLLHDLVNSGKFRFVNLMNTHRQNKDSSILINRDLIINGNTRLIQDNSCIIYHFDTNTGVMEKIKEITSKYYDKTNLQNFHIITPQKRGNIGVYSINEGIQSMLHDADEPHFVYGDYCFYIGDKVMTTRNYYKKDDNNTEYFNGDLWQVKDFGNEGKLYLISDSNSEICLEGDMLDDVTLAYAITVHKCQGSEGKTILLVLPDSLSVRMISKSLLYTAATRPKDKLIIISVGTSLERFILSPMHTNRNSDLSNKLEQAEY